jgi:hypothetical protein
VFLTIKGEHHYLWRAVDQDGNVLDILVQRRRDKTAAKKCFRKLLKGVSYVPRVIVTDKLKSYGAAKRELLPEWNIASTGLSIIAPRTPTTPRANASDACSGLSLRATPTASSLPMAPSPNISVHAGIGCPPLPIVTRCGRDFRAGGRSRLQRSPPEEQRK